MRALKLSFCGARVELKTDCAPLLAALAHLYRPFLEGEISAQATEISAEPQACRAWLEGEIHYFGSVGDAVYELDQLIEPRLLAHTSPQLRVHAAAVESATHTILLVGPSGSGKTTLAMELVRRGMRYLSDEFAIVDPRTGTLQPFPRAATRKAEGPYPAGTRIGFLDGWGFRDYVLPDLRADLTTRSLRSRWILFPTHRTECVPTAEILEPGECCARFLPSIFDFEGAEQKRWPALASLVAGSRACTLDFQDASADLDLALELLGNDGAWTTTTQKS